MPLMGTFDILDISYFDSVDLLCYIYTIFNCPPPVKEGGTLKTGCVCLSVCPFVRIAKRGFIMKCLNYDSGCCNLRYHHWHTPAIYRKLR